MKGFWIACMALACAWAPALVRSQAYPVKPIRLVAPYPPGGIDAYARALLPRATELLGQPVVIENRAGANGFIGAEYVARSAPDGYTLLFISSGTFVYGVALARSVPFDPIRDFTPVANLFETLKILTVHASLPIGSVAELIDYAKRNPGKLTYASAGIGSVQHLVAESFKSAAGVDILHIPYKGTAPMATDLLAGRADLGFPAVNNVKPYLGSGKLKVIAVADARRYAGMPDIPTVSETVPAFRPTPSWTAVFGPAGMARPVVDRLNSVFLSALQSTEARRYLDENGAAIKGGSPQDPGATVKDDLAAAVELIRKTGIRAE